MTFADRVDEAIRDSGDWATSQRWYGDKARSIAEVVPETIVPVDLTETQAALVIARFRYADGPRGIRYTDERVSLRPAKTGK